MPAEEREERDLLRKVRSLSRLYLKLLHSTYHEFLLTSPTLPSQTQYHHLKSFLTELTLKQGESVTVGVEEVVEAARVVLGQRIVKQVKNNICRLATNSSSQDFIQETEKL